MLPGSVPHTPQHSSVSEETHVLTHRVREPTSLVTPLKKIVKNKTETLVVQE